MAQDNINYDNSNYNQPAEEEESISISDFLSICASRWRWFAFSLLACLALAAFYLLKTPSTYTRTASLIIKSEGQSGGMASVSETLSDMGIFSASADVQNEVIAFQSPALFAAVIERLGDNVTYTTRHGLKPVVLYGDSLPLKVDFVDFPLMKSASFRIKPEGAGKFALDRFRDEQGKKVDADPIAVNLGDTVATPAGLIALGAGPNYKPDLDFNITVSHMSMPGAIEFFNKKVSVTVVDDQADVIDITMKDVCIPRADDFINTMIEVYNEKWVEDKNQLAVITSNFINDRLHVIESELGNVDSDISKFKSEHLLPDIKAASELYLRRSDENVREQLETSTQQSIASYLRDFAAKTVKDGGLMPGNMGLESNGIEQQIKSYNELLLKRNALADNSSTNNPVVASYDEQLQAMRQAMISSLDNLIKSLDTRMAQLRKADRKTNDYIASSPGQAKYLLSVERQQKVKEALYLFLLQKREENEIQGTFTAFNTRVLTYATGNYRPTAPVARNIILIALIIGMIIPAVCIFINEALNTRIRSREDLKDLQTPFVGEIPHNDSKKYHSLGQRLRRIKARLTGKVYREDNIPPLMVKERSVNIINEAFRMLRANLEFMTSGKGHKIIMVTSFNPGSGKSFVTLNLAAAVAIKGKNRKVLAIDLDMRRASLSETISDRANGIADYLSGSTDSIPSLIRKTACAGLEIIPVGTIPPNPSELLSSDRLKTLLENLRDQYDYIFIDCPPAEIVADASIITHLSDMTLFVVRAGLLDRRALPQIDEFYRSHRYNNLAVVLNGTLVSASPYRRYGSYTSAGKDYYGKE